MGSFQLKRLKRLPIWNQSFWVKWKESNKIVDCFYSLAKKCCSKVMSLWDKYMRVIMILMDFCIYIIRRLTLFDICRLSMHTFNYYHSKISFCSFWVLFWRSLSLTTYWMQVQLGTCATLFWCFVGRTCCSLDVTTLEIAIHFHVLQLFFKSFVLISFPLQLF